MRLREVWFGWLARTACGLAMAAGGTAASGQSLSTPPAAVIRPAPSGVPHAARAVPSRPIATPVAPPGTAPLNTGVPHTLQEALAAAYANNPTLQAQRAALRATDETVPAALAGWRPQVIVTGSIGYAAGRTTSFATQNNPNASPPVREGQKSGGFSSDRDINSVNLTVTQPVYRGGRTRAGANQAENRVRQARAQLIATEQQVFSDTVNAFVNVIQTQQVLELNRNDEVVLNRQLQATNDRFRVGEITRTDVAQAEAALAQATATRQTTEGNLATARATYQRLVGELPDRLIEPQPLRLPVRSVEEARVLAAANNPNVVAAQFNQAQARDAFDVAYSALLPNVSLQGSAFRDQNQQSPGLLQSGAQILANVSIPIYQGGSEYAAIRQARQTEQQARRQVDEARRTATQQAISAWETYAAAKSTLQSNRAAIRSNEIALEGVQREAIVGSRTTLDVLNAEQTLLNSRVSLVGTLANLVDASYAVAAAVGRLTARDLALPVPLYDETAYYNEVHDRWIGTGDFATDQPGR